MLLAANLLPLAGVLFLQWDAVILVIFYCMESLVIGLFNAAKMIKAEGRISGESRNSLAFRLLQLGSYGEDTFMMKIVLVPFFVAHYGGFVIAQTYVFILVANHLMRAKYGLANFLSFDFIINLTAIIFSHWYSYKKNYIESGEYKRAVPAVLMSAPYKRVTIQQLLVILGGFFLILFRGPVGFLVLLIGLKMIFDLRAHGKSHKLSPGKDRALTPRTGAGDTGPEE